MGTTIQELLEIIAQKDAEIAKLRKAQPKDVVLANGKHCQLKQVPTHVSHTILLANKQMDDLVYKLYGTVFSAAKKLKNYNEALAANGYMDKYATVEKFD